ncbi:SSI family serine proteinase inhibitor [Herbidospora yilanensis]|uniref:SSI family serine proteinase inhibitor n=1 Tax=Herbidospora yilanensis TaxID=354426 RepID=UPI0007837A9D|nr:SSI family serine proteinase inhibitor [Herbidospora yilanensis]
MRAFFAAAVVAVPLFAAHPAVAETPVGALILTMTVDGGAPTAAKLFCDPDGGTHTTPTQACDLLRPVRGDLGRLTHGPGQICTKEYLPHRVTAVGVWEGKPIRYARTFGNRCEMIAATGAVFTF